VRYGANSCRKNLRNKREQTWQRALFILKRALIFGTPCFESFHAGLMVSNIGKNRRQKYGSAKNL
jgi:hypothetical protein